MDEGKGQVTKKKKKRERKRERERAGKREGGDTRSTPDE